MNQYYRWFKPSLYIAAVCILFDGCGSKHKTEEEENPASVKATVSVRVQSIIEQNAVIAVSATGKTDALHKEKLYSPIAGKIISLKVFEGTEIRTGDIVAVIQTKESNAAILGAESMLQSAATPEQRAEAERVLKIARSSQNSVNVLAKCDGIVSSRSVSEGELVQESIELVTIIDLSTVDFIADVPLREISSIHIGQRSVIEFQSIPLKKFSAVVDAINPQSDVQSQTVKVRLRFDKPLPSPLRTDIIGIASITIGVRRNAFFVPKSALLRNDESNIYSIVIMTNDSLALSVPVKIGITTDSLIEITGSELRRGMPVITEGNYSLQDSTKVTAQPQEIP